MEVATTTGASLRPLTEWHSIDWKTVHRNVRRLQTRIVKALQEGKKRKVRALQAILTRSFSGKALAVRRVTENQGKNTPGVDKVIWNTPVKKAQAVVDLQHSGYRPKPLKRVYIPKSDGRQRPLSIPCMKDRAMQALHLLALDPIAETTADPNSYGFRKERSTADAINQCFQVLVRPTSAQWTLEGDIKSCFDELDHRWVLANIPMEKAMLRRWLKAGYIYQHVWNETEAGTPQGGTISPVIMNMALDGLERLLREKFPPTPGKGQLNRLHFIRFADDFIVTGRTKELVEGEVKSLVQGFLKERGLVLSPHKTKTTQITDGFDFLGKNLRKYKGKLLVKPSSKSVHGVLSKIRQTIKVNLHTSVANLILKLNPIIRGWANYHRHTVSKKTFERVDHEVFLSLWSWAERRHPMKGRSWIKEKYFKSEGTRNWVLQTSWVDKHGETKTLVLFKASDVAIKRHIKIKGEANPYDPQWEPYFEERLGLQMVDNLKERKRLLRLWLTQEGRCLVCHQKITKESGWNIHHLQRRTDGGTDTIANLVVLHPNCHRQVHSQKLEVTKPCPVEGH
ncbi:MAG: group II intron reverse transcriptase/maturase [Pyrinomonadaceae bacterium]|nr:group II intron reverse transcriptase/maturase [Pyrinomonadaceae bacterium]